MITNYIERSTNYNVFHFTLTYCEPHTFKTWSYTLKLSPTIYLWLFESVILCKISYLCLTPILQNALQSHQEIFHQIILRPTIQRLNWGRLNEIIVPGIWTKNFAIHLNQENWRILTLDIDSSVSYSFTSRVHSSASVNAGADQSIGDLQDAGVVLRRDLVQPGGLNGDVFLVPGEFW